MDALRDSACVCCDVREGVTKWVFEDGVAKLLFVTKYKEGETKSKGLWGVTKLVFVTDHTEGVG